MTQKNSLTDIKEIVRLSYLYDFYGPLLKDRHREIFEQYILNDLSLSEIAQKYEAGSWKSMKKNYSFFRDSRWQKNGWGRSKNWLRRTRRQIRKSCWRWRMRFMISYRRWHRGI